MKYKKLTIAEINMNFRFSNPPSTDHSWQILSAIVIHFIVFMKSDQSSHLICICLIDQKQEKGKSLTSGRRIAKKHRALNRLYPKSSKATS